MSSPASFHERPTKRIGSPMKKPLKRLWRRLAARLSHDSDLRERLADAERRLRKQSRIVSGLRFLQQAAPATMPPLLDDVWRSKSQHWQDLFVLLELGQKRNGYFVEFGAASGVGLSNTYLLESQYGWTGILAEPAQCWHAELRVNRNCHIETRCVWRESGQSLSFNETTLPVLSTISDYSASDLHAKSRQRGTQYDVETISLFDLLRKYDAPSTIDYLSIDTEGSEYEILSHFDFERYRFRTITCEHNHSPMRQKLFDLLTSKGYQRRFETLSGQDDWYVKTDK